MAPARAAPLRRTVALLLSLAALALLPGGPRALSAEGDRIASIEIRGNRILREGFLLGKIRLTAGSPYREAELESAIRDLYAAGIAQVRKEISEGPEGLRIVLHVTENPVVERIDQEGCPKKIWRDVMESSGLTRGSLLFPTDLAEIKRKLLSELRERGFWKAEVAEEVKEGPAGVSILFRVTQGPKARVVSLRYEGNRSIKDGRIRKGAPVATRKRLFFFFGGIFDPEAWAEDLARIERFYRNEGWLDAKIEGRQEVSPNGKRIRLKVLVTEGEQLTLESFEVKEETRSLARERYLEKVKSAAGQPYVPRQVEADVEAIREAFWNAGYFNVAIRWEPTFDSARRTARVTVAVKPGEPVSLRSLDFQGNGITRSKVLRREFSVAPGEELRWGEVREGMKRLEQLGYFKRGSINHRVQETGDPASRDVIVEVEEDRTAKVNVGGGITSDNAIFADIEFHERNFDLRRVHEFPFMKGGGQELLIAAMPGSRFSRYRLSFFEPWLLDRPVGFGFDVYLNQRIYRLYTEERRGGTVTLSRRLTRSFTIGSRFKIERIRIGDVDLDAPGSVKDAEGTTAINSVEPFLSWDRRDSRIFPTRGWLLDGSYEVAGGRLGGVDFSKAQLGWHGYKTVYEDRDERRHVLSARLEGGWVEAYGDTPEVPIFERFFAGGATTIRGFAFRSVSPRQGGEVVGGNFRLLSSLEYTFPLVGEEDILRGALFADRGVVTRNIEDNYKDDFRSSVGAGIRLRVPGLAPLPIQLDFGFPLEREEEDRKRVFSFVISGMY